MRIIKWPKWYIILSVLFIIFFFVYHYKSPSTIRSKKFDRDVLAAFNGVVLGKYIDTKNHNYKTCLILAAHDTIKVLLDFDRSGLYSYLNEGDSIMKSSGNSKIIVIRNNISKEFVLRYE
jgi:hypothetical protein